MALGDGRARRRLDAAPCEEKSLSREGVKRQHDECTHVAQTQALRTRTDNPEPVTTLGGNEMAGTLSKADIIDAVAIATEMSKKDAGVAVNALLDVIQGSLKKGNKIQFTGFGTFEVRERKARKGKNLRTGETITIAASKAPSFKAGKALKDAMK